MQYYAADGIMKKCGGFTECSKLLATDGISRERETKCERSVSIGSSASDQQGMYGLLECVMCVCMFAKETCLDCYGETLANEISARVITMFGLSLEIILGKTV